MKLIHGRIGNEIPITVITVSQHKVTHMAAGHNSHIKVGIKLLSKCACKAENKTKEQLKTLMRNNDSLMSSPLWEYIEV